MKIFGFEISKQEIKNEVQSQPAPLMDYVSYKQSIYRIASDMANYKYAVLSAENMIYPSRYSLYQIYINTVLDAHLSAVWEQRKNLTLRKEFCIKNEKGEIDDIKTEILNKKWFRKFIELSLESKLWGHSLIQLGDYDKTSKEFLSCVLVPRQYVNPPKHIVTKTQNEQTGLDYLSPEYKDWVVSIGEEWDLGLLMKAAPYIIWKKNSLGAWAEYQESFGVPLRIGKTNSNDPHTRTQFENFLSNFGISKWGLFKENDKIEIIDSANQDAYQVFLEMINTVNAEISKLFLGQTSTTDEKAYAGSAEVHERVLDTYEDADEHFIMTELNYKLKPLLVSRGLLSVTDIISYKEDESIDPMNKIKIDAELMKYFNLSPEYILETYGTEVEAKEIQESKEYKNKLNEYYGD